MAEEKKEIIDIMPVDEDAPSDTKELTVQVNKRLSSMAMFFKGLKKELDDIRTERDFFREELALLREQGNFPIRVESPEQDLLRKALGQASLDCLPLEMTGQAQGNKKSFTLEDVHRSSWAALRKNGISISFEERKDADGKHVLVTVITHPESGQFKVLTTGAEPTNNPIKAHAIKGGYSLAMKRMLQQLLNIGAEEGE
jgi:hypothetical protein